VVVVVVGMVAGRGGGRGVFVVAVPVLVEVVIRRITSRED